MKDIVIQTFLELHAEEHGVRSYPEECPCCEMSNMETRETFRIVLNEEVYPIVEGSLEQWKRLAYPIANKEEVPEGLAVALTDVLLKFVRPGAPYEEFEPEDIQNHPYVKEKYDEVKNKK